MNNASRQRRSSRRRGCRRNRRIMYGGAGMGYNFGAPVAGQHIINNYDGTVQPYASCNEATRPGFLTGSAAAIKGGLPGFAGGGRRRSNSMPALPLIGGRRSESAVANFKGQMGGRYGFVPQVVNGVGIMEPRYTGCGEGLAAVQNPLNKDAGFPGSVLTAPPPQVPVPTPMKGGRRRRAYTQRAGGSYAVDAMVYEAPRSGYSHVPSNSAGGNAGTLADGKTPFLVNVPYSAQPAPSSACLKTGGGRKSRRKGRKSKKSRKGTYRKRK